MSVFDDVAQNPRKGDIVHVRGGFTTYEVVDNPYDPYHHNRSDFDVVVVGVRISTLSRATSQSPYEQKDHLVPIQMPVWVELLRNASTVERGPNCGSAKEDG